MSTNIPPLVYVEDISTNGTRLLRASQPYDVRQSRNEIPMSGNLGIVLLNNQDGLRINDHLTADYCPLQTFQVPPDQFDEMHRLEHQCFAERYTIHGRKLGLGGHGSVYVAVHQQSQRQLACKIVGCESSNELYSDRPWQRDSKKNESSAVKEKHEARVHRIFSEFNVLKSLNHPNIITLEKVFCGPHNIYIFQQLVTGGDLFSFIEKRGSTNDVESAVILRQILEAVDYLHDRNIVHRDLKPDNILMTSTKPGARILLSDFGAARSIPVDGASSQPGSGAKERMFSVVGTLEYAAPEIHKKNKTLPKDRGYTKAVDMWAIGCIASALLTGDVVFTDRHNPSYRTDPGSVILTMAAECNLEVLDTSPLWEHVGVAPKDFIRGTLMLDESKRLTVKQALAHFWFANPRHVADFNAVYQKSIEGWRPKRKTFKLIERIVPSPSHSHLQEAGRSSYFTVPMSTPASALAVEERSKMFTASPLPPIAEEAESVIDSDHGVSPFQDDHGAATGLAMQRLSLSQHETALESEDELMLSDNTISHTGFGQGGGSCELDTVVHDSPYIPDTPPHGQKRRPTTYSEGLEDDEMYEAMVNAAQRASPAIDDAYERTPKRRYVA
ncbi:kinase-like protein [Saccharata proteae CBS 121410]|uniref:Kinase-like protein n=1 Tax=Saccharata proteae CBS 121410 TaxID=1314787 RepID=A0A9P4HS65_9PEZI|nr:kinase-like protein [Saccharata proteae CBS 121410]